MIGFYAGSFDPFTNGHLEIVKKASKCFSKLIIGIGYNVDKPERIDKKKMKKAIEETIKEENLNNIEVVLYQGLTIDKAKELNSEILIRGLRNGTDYQYEENISAINEKVAGIDTCYFRAGKLGYLSSSIVMELYNNNKKIDKFVPKAVAQLLYSLRKGEL
ncbi:MAG: pantetheine-phosphate adenylyltransferase [Clostridia bacterium]|nr:pantetheine-phosphate adenylyltransferase [Clostridia bacterium]